MFAAQDQKHQTDFKNIINL